MSSVTKPPRLHKGSSLIEVLVTLVILLLGLLGLVGLMLQSQRSQLESYQRAQALVILQDMVNRMNTNRKSVACYAITTGNDGTPYLGTGYAGAPTCTVGTAAQQARAISDLTEWSNLLKGSNEKLGTNDVGAMVGARGCISSVTTGTTTVYTVSVVWQGKGSTVVPGVNCANGLFDAAGDSQRRAVSVPVQIAALS